MFGCAHDPCESMTPRECGYAAQYEEDFQTRRSLAVASCRVGSAAGCSTLGLQLLLDSEHDPQRRYAAYRAFQVSCESHVPFLCEVPVAVELVQPEPNHDIILNVLQGLCTRQDSHCHLVPEAKRRAGRTVSEQELSEARDYEASNPYVDIDDTLSAEGSWATQYRGLQSLPADTPGNLWTYGMSDEE